MTTQALSEYQQSNHRFYTLIRIPSKWVEYAFYFAMFYSLTADIWGVSIPLLAGMMFLGLSALSIVQHSSYIKTFYARVGWLIACATSFLLIQLVVHEESIADATTRGFIMWIAQLTLVYSLCARNGFARRYPFVLFIIALAVVPDLTLNPGAIERARVNVDLGVQGGLAHPNGLGEWFGFFAIYFAISGLEANRFVYRLGAWGIAVGCFFVVGLTVSRGSLLGAVLAIVIAFRKLLRRGFLPTLMLVLLVAGAYESGIFDNAVHNYEERAEDRSGRERLWPAAIERLFSSPMTLLTGVGQSKVGLAVLSARQETPPHNTFLYLASASGVIPFIFFLAFWIQASWRCVMNAETREDDIFRIPYLVFTFIVVMVGDLGCMSPWGLLTTSIAAGSSIVSTKQRFVVARIGDKVKFALYPPSIARGRDTTSGS